MPIPLWLPWVIALALLVAALPRPESRLRTWGPFAVALTVAAWLTVDHLRVTQDELAGAAEAAAAHLDGAPGGLTRDRVARAVEDRLGHEVSVERATDEDGDPSAGPAYTYTVRLPGDDDGPAACIRVHELRTVPAAAGTQAMTSADSGTCTPDDERGRDD